MRHCDHWQGVNIIFFRLSPRFVTVSPIKYSRKMENCSSAQLHQFWQYRYGIVASTTASWLAYSPLAPDARVRIPAGATQLKWRNQLLYTMGCVLHFFVLLCTYMQYRQIGYIRRVFGGFLDFSQK